MELLKIPNSSSNFEREKQSWWHHTFWFQNIVKMKVSQSYPTLCDPMDYTVHGILQAKLLEWVAFPFSRGSSQPRGSNSGFLHCRQILYQLSHKGSPFRRCTHPSKPPKAPGWSSPLTLLESSTFQPSLRWPSLSPAPVAVSRNCLWPLLHPSTASICSIFLYFLFIFLATQHAGS